MFSAKKSLNLALQGGGAHGAFTWGVLDRLLEDDLELGWISGTSAGAVNAVALADGLLRDGRQGGRERLRRVWDAVEAAGISDLARLNPFLYGMARASGMSGLGPFVSPYDFNPLGFDPLRKLLAASIDFDRIRDEAGPELIIAATDVGSGCPRLFRRRQMSIEVVLASACLPQLHHAVEIEGRAYWDGGFSANPDIVTLGSESPVRDTLIVQLNPLDRQSLPRSARDIGAQINTITFNQPLLRDVELIVAAQEEAGGHWLFARPGRLTSLARHRFHIIDAGRYTSTLRAESKAAPERSVIAYLFASGRMEAARWLERHRDDIGRRQSADLRRIYLDSPRAQMKQPPGETEAKRGGTPHQ
ncbi:MAG: patatin-like phospholipase family protein, partial [Hyphomicrobiaceae bacterium]